MSEDPTPYAGHTALCAAFERGAGVEAENAELRAYRTHYLADLTDAMRRFLVILAELHRSTGKAWIRRGLLSPAQNADLWQTGEWPSGLVDVQTADKRIIAYRLTPFGAQVAAALRKE